MSTAKAPTDAVKQIHYLAGALRAPRITELRIKTAGFGARRTIEDFD